MEQPPSSLKLFGSWASSYTHRVQLALKIKNVNFEYVEEDLANKSPSLLLHNPVYKKVPVLLHLDRPIVESVIILHYIDETWPDQPIIPADPYERSLARFWSYFADDKLGPAVAAVFGSAGEDQKAAVGQVHENLKLIETELREGAFKGRRFFGGDRIGILDIVLGCGSYWLAVFDEVMEVKLVDPEAFPLFRAWLQDFEEQEEVKEIIPPTDRLLEYARGIRQMMLSLKDTTTSTATATATTTNASNVVIESGTSV